MTYITGSRVPVRDFRRILPVFSDSREHAGQTGQERSIADREERWTNTRNNALLSAVAARDQALRYRGNTFLSIGT
jgi:hypothetical protein